MTESTALLTDRYEVTMVDAALRAGTHERECVFEVFARHLPAGRRYGVVGGTGRMIDLVKQFRFGEPELTFLSDNAIIAPDTIDYLAQLRFTGSIEGYREGDLYFPGSPILTVTAPFAQAVLLETLILSVFNYDSAVASAASRMVTAAAGRPLAEMGSRRTGEHSAVAAARAAYIAGFSSTSNLEAGRSWGIPTMGTAAHAFTLMHDTEEAAFRAQVEALGSETTLLVDTFDVERGVETAVRVAGCQLGAVRLDSGDLATLARQTRTQLDALGARKTAITVTNDLDEFTIAALRSSPIDSYGVGTSVVTGSGAPACGMVYKLVAHRTAGDEWVSVAKRSDGKESVGGRKWASREFSADGKAQTECVSTAGFPETPTGANRRLQVTFIDHGEADEKYQGRSGVALARTHHNDARAELPDEALSLDVGEPAIPTILS